MKTGILLINLGTPDSPSTRDVRKYLREFLMDPEVIDINPVARWLLVNLIIAPFRAPKSAKLYEKIWTKEGSPLLIYGNALTQKLQHSLGEDYVVKLAMRYRNPSIRNVLREMMKENVEKIIAVPLYPQYASSSTGSTITRLEKEIAAQKITVPVKIISRFHQRREYIDAVAAGAGSFDLSQYDHVLFSFHGVPERHITKTDAKLGNGKCYFGNCCDTIHAGNEFCYRANCLATAHDVARKLSLSPEKYTISFQSRLGRTPWIRPYSDEIIAELAQKGKKKILAFSPAFVADCLETIYEIGVEYDELFRRNGGEKVQLVPSLNADDSWVAALQKIILS
ncbi:MAG TPA: ferrochelatase [Bacteroidia bacterium]|nr:ferrochelatase [Bacteroidia bacterium]